MQRHRNHGRKLPAAIARAMQGMVVALMILLCQPPPAHAHRVYVFAWVEGNRVHTESYSGGNKRVVNGRIQAFDSTGARVAEGKTDDKGAFSFPLPRGKDLRIVLETGMGHRAEYLLKAPGEGPSGDSLGEEPAPGLATPQSRPARADREEIRRVVEEVLDVKLAPIRQELVNMRKAAGPGFKEVAAGFGYILGIMGLVLYFRSRRRQEPPQDRR